MTNNTNKGWYEFAPHWTRLVTGQYAMTIHELHQGRYTACVAENTYPVPDQRPWCCESLPAKNMAQAQVLAMTMACMHLTKMSRKLAKQYDAISNEIIVNPVMRRQDDESGMDLPDIFIRDMDEPGTPWKTYFLLLNHNYRLNIHVMELKDEPVRRCYYGTITKNKKNNPVELELNYVFDTSDVWAIRTIITNMHDKIQENWNHTLTILGELTASLGKRSDLAVARDADASDEAQTPDEHPESA